MASGSVDFSAEHGARLAVAERLEGTGRLAVLGEEAAGFFDEAVGEHPCGAGVEAGVEGGAGRIEADAENAIAGEGVAAGFPGFGEGLAGGEADLDGADELGLVVRVDALRGGWIEAAEETVQPCRAVALGAAAKPGAQFFGTLRAGEESLEQGAQVEAGAAGDDGEMVARDDCRRGLRVRGERSRRRS
jgi:hypothetical protein